MPRLHASNRRRGPTRNAAGRRRPGPIGAPGGDRPSRHERTGNEIAELVSSTAHSGGEQALLVLWEQIHQSCAEAETALRDTVTAQLTFINAAFGAAGLEECLRAATEAIWVPRMTADISCAAVDGCAIGPRRWRSATTGRSASGNRTTDGPSRWIPWGRAGRQILEGRYRPPYGFGVVQGGSSVGVLREDITVYQAHLAVAHTLVPIERIGVPWPAIRCAGWPPGHAN